MIEAVKLTKTFGDKVALDCVDIKIEEGSIFGLVGSNGSGKSTLLRLIAGVYTQDSGKLIVDNMSVFNNLAMKSKICYLPDTPYFIHQANIEEMLKRERIVRWGPRTNSIKCFILISVWRDLSI